MELYTEKAWETLFGEGDGPDDFYIEPEKELDFEN
jgi:hypothetical protein